MVVGWGLSCKPITLILYSNFEIFVTVVTGVGLRQITLRSYIRWPPNSPKAIWLRIKDICAIQKSNCDEFSVTIFKSSLPLQQGSSEQSLTDSSKLTDPENPLVGARIRRYQLQKLHVSYSRFCVENRKCLLRWQQQYGRAKCDSHRWICRPRKPYHRNKN